MINKYVLSVHCVFLTAHLSSKTQFQEWRLARLQLFRAQERNNRDEYNPELELAHFNF